MDLFDDPNLTFSKLGAAWLLSLDPKMKIGVFTKALCAAMERVVLPKPVPFLIGDR